jgi:putative ABC transport system substrate-binding protein
MKIGTRHQATGNSKKTRIFDLMLGAMLFALSSTADAQQTEKVARIGYLSTSTASGSAVLLDAFRQELSKLGWIENKNIAIEHRFAEGKRERVPELAADLVRLHVGAIVVVETQPALAVKTATSTVPIVMINVGDPVSAGLVASLARPGGNVTGLSGLSQELITKRLEILKDAVPGLTQVAVLWSGGGAGTQLQLKEIRAAGPALGLKLHEIKTELDPKGLESAFQTAIQKRVNAVITTSNNLIFTERKRVANLASKYRLPAIFPQKEFVEDGGLMAYGLEWSAVYRRAAVYVDKILKGAKPADLPVEQPTKFEFVINLKAAKQIGLTIPPNVLARADRVIK